MIKKIMILLTMLLGHHTMIFSSFFDYARYYCCLQRTNRQRIVPTTIDTYQAPQIHLHPLNPRARYTDSLSSSDLLGSSHNSSFLRQLSFCYSSRSTQQIHSGNLYKARRFNQPNNSLVEEQPKVIDMIEIAPGVFKIVKQ